MSPRNAPRRDGGQRSTLKTKNIQEVVPQGHLLVSHPKGASTTSQDLREQRSPSQKPLPRARRRGGDDT